MPLQTDPTVLYAKGEHSERVYYKDLDINSPYNTYKYQGLPPGPIANAGNASIKAALEPEKTKYLYFLATPEGDVLYSQTLAEHNTKKAEHITNNYSMTLIYQGANYSLSPCFYVRIEKVKKITVTFQARQLPSFSDEDKKI